MLDDLERLRTSEPMRQLLTHHCRLADPNRDAWQDRLMSLDGVDARELMKLHGLLIAMDWIELKVGHLSAGTNSPVPACYRVTNAGLRALRQISDSVGEVLPIDEVSTAPRRKREKCLEPEAAAA
jgi:hypothetical protein